MTAPFVNPTPPFPPAGAPSRAAVLDALRARCPEMDCIPGCTACCGPVPWSREEFSRLSPAQQERLRTAFTLQCPFAVEGKGCAVYEERPLTCRLYGVARGLECLQGQSPPPGGLLTDEEAADIWRTYQETFFSDTQEGKRQP